MKRILYFFPINPYEQNEGNKMRAFNLLKYFRLRNFQVDFVGQYGSGSKWLDEEVASFKQSGLVDNVFLLHKKPQKNSLVQYFFNYKIPNFFYQRKQGVPKNSISDNTTYYLRYQFDQILDSRNYDYVIISYVNWSALIHESKKLRGAKTIIDTHDLISSQSQVEKFFDAGKALGEEIKRLNFFDEIWAISTEEHYLFSQFCSKSVRHITMMVDEPEEAVMDKKYDLIYVASSNVHNRNSARWFFSAVYPLLPKHLKICVIGKITEYLDTSFNVELVKYAKDLNLYYSQSKIALCPMLSGTGIKVKVVEALSHGLPVVCTERGLDGLPNKINNGCLVGNEASEFANHICSLAGDPSFYQQQSIMAKNIFRQVFETNVCYKALDKAFNVN